LGNRNYQVSQQSSKCNKHLLIWGSRHVKPNTLKTLRFHGKARPTSPSGLADSDIVLTTYATLSSDYKHRGVLHQVNWYRVVLDEGKLGSVLIHLRNLQR
jgi:SNF2 family DNA or RNA helicase